MMLFTNRGFSLPEVLVALVLVSATLCALLNQQLLVNQQLNRQIETIATDIAAENQTELVV